MATVPLAVHEAADEQGHACAICQTGIAPGEPVGRCPSCDAPYHGECWEENGGCASYGCPNVPNAPKEEGPAAGSSYWGQEDKKCPGCGATIRLAALRCRHCGRTFESREPEAARTGPAAKPSGAVGIALFVAGLVPVTAPLVLVVGGPALWLGRRRVRRWPPTRRAMAIIGVVASAIVTLVLGLALALFEAKPAPPPVPPPAAQDAAPGAEDGAASEGAQGADSGDDEGGEDEATSDDDAGADEAD